MIFLAHQNDIVEGEYITLPQLKCKKVLAKKEKIFLVSNICPHQKSLISRKDGKGIRVCPYHAWSFDINGDPVSSGRTSAYCQNTFSLEKNDVYDFNGLLFDDLLDIEDFPEIDTFNLAQTENRIDIVNSNYKNIMNVFLDVDHIPIVHRGVYDEIGITDVNTLIWKFFKNGSLQIVKNVDGTIVAVWLAIYPYTMIEWQYSSMFVTVCNPIDDQNTEVSVFKYKNTNSNDKIYLQNEKIWEIAWAQDKDLSEIIQETEIINLEESKLHFLNWRLANGIN